MSLENIEYCEEFHPSEEEFENFEMYVSSCEKSCKSGIFKVIPPRNWKPRKDNYKNLEFNIPFPIEQIVTGNSGVYEVFLIQRESRSLSKYKKLVESFDNLTESKKPIEIEKLFWKNLKLSAPLYGADSPGSIFDPNVNWNLSELDSLLKRGLDMNGILGVTSPYLYVGAWKTLFAWHKEDMDLFSINYNHFGKPKFWYAIPVEDGPKFEEFMKKNFPESYKDCPEFLRHKTFLVHPEVLMKNGIKLNKCVQKAGEFVITLASAYHCGFNSGFNLAEAVNFGLYSWIELGKKAKTCKCRRDSVKINMDDFVLNLRSQGRSPSSTSEQSAPCPKREKIENWLKCFLCEKWRKVPKIHLKELEIDFNCSMLKRLTCDSPEENLKNYTIIKSQPMKKNIKSNLKNSTVKSKKKQNQKKKLKKKIYVKF